MISYGVTGQADNTSPVQVDDPQCPGDSLAPIEPTRRGGVDLDAPGRGDAEVQAVRGANAVTRLRSTSPLRLLAPGRSTRRGTPAWLVASGYGGGLVEGDHVDVRLTLGEGAVAAFTTQASTKVFRSERGGHCRQSLQAVLAPGSTLVVYPDPVQCFAQARYVQRQRFDLADDSSLVLLDWYTSGRSARGERWRFDRYDSRSEVWLGDRPILIDATRLDAADGPIDDPLKTGRFNCFASLFCWGTQCDALVAQCTEQINAVAMGRRADLLACVSPMERGVICRIAGVSTESVEQLLEQCSEPLARLLGRSPVARKW